MGRTATHEVGHYVGLYHTFEGCDGSSGCYVGGDLICDTNAQSQATNGCPSSHSSCGSPDPFHNYMDYTNDACIWEFTPEQMNRARCTLINWRPDVHTEDCGSGGIGTGYCQSTTNSSGQSATIEADGSTSIASNNMRLLASGLPVNEFGLFYYGDTQIEQPFGDGFRCVGGALNRLNPPQLSDALGENVRPLDFSMPPMSAGVAAGVTLNFQHWFRDPLGAGGNGFNLSDGLSVIFTP